MNCFKTVASLLIKNLHEKDFRTFCAHTYAASDLLGRTGACVVRKY